MTRGTSMLAVFARAPWFAQRTRKAAARARALLLHGKRSRALVWLRRLRRRWEQRKEARRRR
ncbi:hypothetical protein [Sutterella sp.]|uniref:hypothetical protein n=1 Tax=Sutterella sp. TaxID=1981025 RepID=UPI0026E00CE3|nr:hypothetical protein [Sutterella sp.]MDO5532592.1 hypothetical protein [Sutterella sp.]